MKYIPAEKLLAEIERRMKDYNASVEKYYNKQKSIKAERDSWKWAECKWFLNLITSLQQEQPDCHTVEDWIQHIKNADQLTKDIFSKGPYDVLYDALNHPYQHCYDAIKEFGELCFQTGVNSVKQEQPEVDLEKEIDACWQNWISPSNQSSVEGVLPKSEFYMYARHFYELGLNARKIE